MLVACETSEMFSVGKSGKRRAFTLIELLIVMAVIAVILGLILGTSGYVRNRAARDRAQVEIAALEAALERFKADNGIYPETPPGRDDGGNADILYRAISGDGNQGSAYWQPREDQLNRKNGFTEIVDPFGRPYNYVCPGYFNTTTFDLWSGPARMNENLKRWEDEELDAKNW